MWEGWDGVDKTWMGMQGGVREGEMEGVGDLPYLNKATFTRCYPV